MRGGWRVNKIADDTRYYLIARIPDLIPQVPNCYFSHPRPAFYFGRLNQSTTILDRRNKMSHSTSTFCIYPCFEAIPPKTNAKPSSPSDLDVNDPFLHPHLPEPRRKALLTAYDVTSALIEQVEALLRRQKQYQSSFCEDTNNTDDDDDDDSGVRPVPSVSSIARISSVFAPTVITTLSADTRKAGNHHRSGRYRQKSNAASKQQQQPRIVGGMEFVQSETLRKKIQNIIYELDQQSWWERRLGSFFGSSTNFVSAYSRAHESALLSCWSPTDQAQEETDIALHSKVQRYSAVLHLRMKMKSYHFYKLHFSRRRPQHAYTKMMKTNIQTTLLSPTSFDHQEARVPEAVNVSDESSDSSSAASFLSSLDFGIGPPAQAIQLLVTDTVFLDLAMAGSLGLNPPKPHPRAAYRDRKVLLAPEHCLVLLNRRSGVPLAVCTVIKASSTTTTAPRVRIYTTRHRVGLVPVTTTDKCSLLWCKSLPLYNWAEFRCAEYNSSMADEDPMTVSYSIHTVSAVSGNTFERNPRFRAMWRQSQWLFTGSTSREFHRSGCATLSMCQEDEESDIFWKLSIAQGIDPAIFICFTSFLDEMMEYTMRTQCHSKAQPRKMVV
jgi:hypothetical protein